VVDVGEGHQDAVPVHQARAALDQGQPTFGRPANPASAAWEGPRRRRARAVRCPRAEASTVSPSRPGRCPGRPLRNRRRRVARRGARRPRVGLVVSLRAR
jgi:hypothetical protein